MSDVTDHGYSFGATTNLSMSDAREKVTAALKARGFGILTEIDVQATLKAKLDKDTRPYVILGACNPTFAHQALADEPNLGVLLPCNVLLYETESGAVQIEAMDTAAVLGVVDNETVATIATEVRALIHAAITEAVA